jgi:hypothetical protein
VSAAAGTAGGRGRGRAAPRRLALLRCCGAPPHRPAPLTPLLFLLSLHPRSMLELLDKAPREFKDYCECLDYYT